MFRSLWRLGTPISPPRSLDEWVNTYELFPSEAPRALAAVRARYWRDPMTASEFLLDLTKNGMPKLAALARRDIEIL